MTDVRSVAYSAILLDAEGRGSGSLSKDVLARYSYLDRQDKSFLKRLIEGVIERKITLDHVLDHYSSVPTSKMKKPVLALCRMGAYQLLFMDNVAEYAAVNETVAIAKKTKVRGLSGFINGVLRSIAKNRDGIPYPKREDGAVKYMSVAYSCPEWIVAKLCGELGEDKAETLLCLSVSARDITARVNLSKTTPDEVKKRCDCRICDILPYAITLNDPDNIADIEAFSDGSICIQDISSMLVCHVAGIREGDTILDLCAAPGGKSLHAADIATSGRVIACDVSEKKTAKITENANRCGFSNIEIVKSDATVYNAAFDGIADVVLADVPCSGLGVMGRKNDIKYNLTPESIGELASLSRKILENAARYVKSGGTLMFSTCTCSKAENEENMDFLIKECGLLPVDFYDELPEIQKDESAKKGFLQLYGKDASTDGFFIAKLRK